MEKKDFSKLNEELQYFTVENPTEKTIEEVADEIREFIKESGWDVLEEDWNVDKYAEEWIDENHPEIDANGYWVCDLDFLCENEYFCEHDVDWKTITIGFHGDWDKQIGIFSVEQV